MRRTLAVALAVTSTGCVSRSSLVSGDEIAQGHESSTGPSMTTSSSSSAPATTSGASESTGDGTTSSSFVPPTDTPAGECSPWTENCPAGAKCMPWANDGGNSWNDLKCTPIADDPRQPGAQCTVEMSGVSGIDDCDLHSMCWGVDPETNTGTCVSFCVGSADAPTCAAPCERCAIANDGVLALCLGVCDPITQNCDDGLACFAFNDAFVCLAHASPPDLGEAGDLCEYVNACDPGLVCVGAELLPGCPSAIGCCTEFCDPASPPDGQCTFAADGVECVPWFDGPSAIESCIESTVGACVLP